MGWLAQTHADDVVKEAKTFALGRAVEFDAAGSRRRRIDESWSIDGAKSLPFADFVRLVAELLDQLATLRATEALARLGAPQLRASFDRFDTDKSGRIELKELSPALNALGLAVDAAGTKYVLEKYDKGARGRKGLDVGAFSALVRDLVGWQQRQQVHLNAAQVETAFRRYDTRGEGHIAATDLRRAVELLGVRPDAGGGRSPGTAAASPGARRAAASTSKSSRLSCATWSRTRSSRRRRGWRRPTASSRRSGGSTRTTRARSTRASSRRRCRRWGSPRTTCRRR